MSLMASSPQEEDRFDPGFALVAEMLCKGEINQNYDSSLKISCLQLRSGI